jgi:hypothetical protein
LLLLGLRLPGVARAEGLGHTGHTLIGAREVIR